VHVADLSEVAVDQGEYSFADRDHPIFPGLPLADQGRPAVGVDVEHRQPSGSERQTPVK
jgi:hypothetical protein